MEITIFKSWFVENENMIYREIYFMEFVTSRSLMVSAMVVDCWWTGDINTLLIGYFNSWMRVFIIGYEKLNKFKYKGI